MLHNQSVAPTLSPTGPVMVALTTSFVVRPTMAVLPGLCPPNWTNNNTLDCINATMDNVVAIGGTSASFTGFPGQDCAVMRYDGNYSLPRDGLFEFEMDPSERVVSTIVPVFFGIIGLAGLLGNALVILAYCTDFSLGFTTCLHSIDTNNGCLRCLSNHVAACLKCVLLVFCMLRYPSPLHRLIIHCTEHCSEVLMKFK